MNRLLIGFGLCVLATQPVLGQTDVEPTEAQLEAARERLESAAREVAELSGLLVGEELADFAGRFSLDQRKAMLGLNIGPAEGDGVAVLGVTPGGPADKGGILAGDVLVSFNGTKLSGEGTRQLIELMRDVEPGETVTLEYRRGDDTGSVELTAEAMENRYYAFAWPEEDFDLDLGPMGPHLQIHRGDALFGRWGELELVSLTPKLGAYFGTDTGLLVVRASEDSTLGLEDGDVIVSIGGREPASPSHAMRILRSYNSGETMMLEIYRQQRRKTLEVVVPDPRDLALRPTHSPRHRHRYRVLPPALET